MKKHNVECPHCSKQFVFTPPVKVKQQSVMHNVVYTECVKYWLQEFHPGWLFGAVQGKSLKSLLDKIKKGIEKSKEFVYSEEFHINMFVHLCNNMPEYFRDKDIQKINSSYNEIVTQMKKGKTNGSKQWHTKNSAERYTAVNDRFKD